MSQRVDALFVGLCAGFAALVSAPPTVGATEPLLEGRGDRSRTFTEPAPVGSMPSVPKNLYDLSVFGLNCSSIDFTPNFVKLTDVGSFYLPIVGPTTVIVTAHGRFGIETLDTGSGAVFEHGFNWIFTDDFESGNTLSW